MECTTLANISRTSTSLTILNGTFFNFKPQSSVSILRINGYVLLAPEVSLQVNGGETLEVNGKLVGNADMIIFIGQTSSVKISGEVRNYSDAGVVINRQRRICPQSAFKKCCLAGRTQCP